MRASRYVSAALAFGGCLLFAAGVGAQAGSQFSGRLLNSFTGEPIVGAMVQLDELRVQTTSGADGMFTFANVPPGTYHLSVRSSGYSSRRTEVTVAAATPAAAIDIRVDPELHFEEVVSVVAD